MPIRYKSREMQEGNTVYNLFKEKEGSEYIATPTNMQAIIDICRMHNVKTVLELGGGIGAITYALVKYTDAHIDVYEEVPYCQKKLRENVPAFESRCTLLTDYRQYPVGGSYDLAIVDGPEDGPDGMTKEDVAYACLNALASVRVVYVEGHRHMQRYAVMRALKDKCVYQVHRIFGARQNEVFLKGGCAIVCVAQGNTVFRAVNHWVQTVVLMIDFALHRIWKRIIKRYTRRIVYLLKRAVKTILFLK